MSSNVDDQDFPARPSGSGCESNKMSKIAYTREFLLSFSELQICKKLPPGIDTSVLSELEDASQNVTEWQRISGGQSLQSSKRSEYGTSPPNVYSRGSHGKWDARSYGSNDTDGQSDRESDTGKRYGSQFRRSLQSTEQDGLLGSGAFPRPSGYGVGGPSASRGRGSGPYNLSKSSEPYQPPRPYKALPHARRDNTDSINDETFGSSECSNQDREEEERMRRASFQLLRKEQQKSLQEKLKHNNPEKYKDHVGMDIDILLDSTEDEKVLWKKGTNRLDDSYSASASQDELVKSLPVGAPSTRPLVPPGFAPSMMDKDMEVKTASEMGQAGREVANSREYENRTTVYQDSNELQNYKKDTVEDPFARQIGAHVVPSSGSGLLSNFDISQAPLASAVWDASNAGGLSGDGVKLTGAQTTGQDTTILQKLFENALTLNDTGSPIFTKTIKPVDNPLNPISSQASKFAHWFMEEEKKPTDHLPSLKPKDLLSLIVNGDNSGIQSCALGVEICTEAEPGVFPSNDDLLAEKPIVATAISGVESNVEPAFHSGKKTSKHGVLTCEDLEQYILSEASDSHSQTSVQGVPLGVLNAKTEPPSADVDNQASQHLLSLLQKGLVSKESESEATHGIDSSDSNGVSLRSPDKVSKTENALTLEALFGSAFMKELQSVGAPVSVQGSSVDGSARGNLSGSTRVLPFPTADPKTSGRGFHVANEESNLLLPVHNLGGKHGLTEPHWSRFDNSQTEGLKVLDAFGPEDRVDGMTDFRLPEEESLITVSSEHLVHDTSNPLYVRDTRKPGDLLSLDGVEVIDKLGGLSSLLESEPSLLPPGLERGPPFHGYDSVESELRHQRLHGQPLPPHFQHHQVDHNHLRPLFPQAMDQNVHRNPHMSVTGMESVSHHDPHHPFPPNMFPHHHPLHGLGAPRFESPPGQSTLQQMPHVPGNFIPPHLLQGLPRGVFMPPPINHMSAHAPPDVGPIQGFSLSQRSPDFSGIGVPMPGYPESRESYEMKRQAKVMEMELRANLKQQAYQVGAGQGNVPGMHYPPELEMGFRYR